MLPVIARRSMTQSLWTLSEKWKTCCGSHWFFFGGKNVKKNEKSRRDLCENAKANPFESTAIAYSSFLTVTFTFEVISRWSFTGIS